MGLINIEREAIFLREKFVNAIRQDLLEKAMAAAQEGAREKVSLADMRQAIEQVTKEGTRSA